MIRLSSGNDDLIECLNVQPLRMGMESVGRDEALRAWNLLAASRSFNSVVVEADPPIEGHRIVGYGASVFVSRAFAREERTNPRPGLNSRIIASIAEGHPVILSEAELRKANTSGDLDLVVLYGCIHSDLLRANGLFDPHTVFDVHSLMAVSFLDDHVGYRIRAVLTETVDETEGHYYDQARDWRVVSNFEEFWLTHPEAIFGRSRALRTIDNDMLELWDFMIGRLFRYQKPVFQLRDEDQQLLTAALTGLTDEALAGRLGQHLPTIKKRWLSLYARTLELYPELFPDWDFSNIGDQRGKQKRHHLLAYIRAHPEELRPVEANAHASSPI